MCNGDKFKDAYNTFKENPQLVAIGINCSNPRYITSLLKSVTCCEKLTKPFIVYPNDGKIWDAAQQK